MKKIIILISLAFMIFVALNISSPKEANAQYGLSVINEDNLISSLEENDTLIINTEMSLTSSNNYKNPFAFGIGLIAGYSVRGGGFPLALDLSFGFINLAIGFQLSTSHSGYFYIHGGVLFPVYYFGIFGFDVGGQLYLMIAKDYTGLGVRIPIEFGINILFIRLFMGVNPMIVILPGINFNFALSLGVRFYF